MHTGISRDFRFFFSFFFFLTLIRIIGRKVSLIRAIFIGVRFYKIQFEMLRNYRGIVLNCLGRNPRNSLEFSAKKGQRPFIVPTRDRISSRYYFRKWHLLDEKLCSRLCFSWIVVQMVYLFSLDDEARWWRMQRKSVLLAFYSYLLWRSMFNAESN